MGTGQLRSASPQTAIVLSQSGKVIAATASFNGPSKLSSRPGNA